jgi:hypothetical protein
MKKKNRGGRPKKVQPHANERLVVMLTRGQKAMVRKVAFDNNVMMSAMARSLIVRGLKSYGHEVEAE